MFGIKVKQLSSLVKVKNLEDFKNDEVYFETLCKGEHFAYQIAVYCEGKRKTLCRIESELKEYITVYTVNDAIVDFPAPDFADDDFITKEVGVMPDILTPLSEQKNIVHLNGINTFWVDVNLPKDCKPGTYSVKMIFADYLESYSENFEISETMQLQVIDSVLPEQETIVTQWMHADCISQVYNVEIYSEEHWHLIDKFMNMASDVGINMILTPVFTPHLDTDYGVERPNVQLVDIFKDSEGYSFDFSRLKRWIALAKKNNFKYFEIAHLFSQWGLKCTPNIKVVEDGEEVLKFGWHTPSQDPEYATFLKQFIPDLITLLDAEGIKDNTYFHISDEPSDACLENYEYASKLVKPLIGNCKIIEACSTAKMVDKKLMDIPAVATNHIHPIIEKGYDEIFAYYCCSQVVDVSNRLIAMPAYRNRIIGMQMYKYNITGFLHWGYNFYYNGGSHYVINPFVTTSANKHFPSGDSFSVYPGKDGPVCSTRAIVFKDALQDIRMCTMLEKYIGRDKVIELINEIAGMEITFDKYPKTNEFFYKFNLKVKEIIEEKQQSI